MLPVPNLRLIGCFIFALDDSVRGREDMRFTRNSRDTSSMCLMFATKAVCMYVCVCVCVVNKDERKSET